MTRLWYLKNANIPSLIPANHNKGGVHLVSMSRVGMYQDIRFPAGTAGQVFIVQSGSIRISRLLRNGHSFTLDILYPGDVFGELPQQPTAPLNEYAEAISNSVIAATTSQSFRELVANHPELHFYAPKQFGARPPEIKLRLTDLAFRDSAGEVIDILSHVCGRFNVKGNDAGVMSSPLSPHEIALLAGISAKAVTAILREIRQLRNIEVNASPRGPYCASG
jgi:CRP/FNR family transcriptional regulator